MSEMISAGTDGIRKYAYLVTKMKFPVSTIPTIINLSKLTVHLFLLLIVMIIFWAFGHPPTIYWLQIPFYMLCMFAFFQAFSLFTAPLRSN